MKPGRRRKATYDLENLMLYDREKTLSLVRELGGPEYGYMKILVGIERWINSIDYNAYRKVRDKVSKELKKFTSHPAGMTAEEEKKVLTFFENLWDDESDNFYFYKLYGHLEMLGRSYFSWRNRVIRNMVKIKKSSPESYENVMKMAEENIKEQEAKNNNVVKFPKKA